MVMGIWSNGKSGLALTFQGYIFDIFTECGGRSPPPHKYLCGGGYIFGSPFSFEVFGKFLNFSKTFCTLIFLITLIQTFGGVPKISGDSPNSKILSQISKMDPKTFEGPCHSKNPASIPEVVHRRSQDI